MCPPAWFSVVGTSGSQELCFPNENKEAGLGGESPSPLEKLSWVLDGELLSTWGHRAIDNVELG